MDKKIIGILVIIIVFHLIIRIPYLQEEYTTDSYFHIRQIEYINNQGTPIINDDITSSGQTYHFLPTYHYIMAILQIFFSKFIVYNIIPVIIGLCNIPIVFLILNEITFNKKYIYILTFFSGFIPEIALNSTNSVNPITLALPLFFLNVYLLYKIRYTLKFQLHIIIALIMLIVIHPISILLILSMYLYFFLSYISKNQIHQTYLEYTFFGTFLSLWLYLIVFKKYIEKFGWELITVQLPQKLIQTYRVDIPSVLSSISILLVITALITVYKSYKNNFSEQINLLFSIGIIIVMSMIIKIIAYEYAIMILSIVTLLISAKGFGYLEKYIKKTYFEIISSITIVVVVLILFVTMSIPTLYMIKNNDKYMLQSELDALLWLKEYSKQESIVFGAPTAAQMTHYITKRKVFFDIGYPDVEDKKEQLNLMKKSYAEKIGLQGLGFFNTVDYFVINQNTNKFFGKKFDLPNRFDCLIPIKEFRNETKIYFNTCGVKT